MQRSRKTKTSIVATKISNDEKELLQWSQLHLLPNASFFVSVSFHYKEIFESQTTNARYEWHFYMSFSSIHLKTFPSINIVKLKNNHILQSSTQTNDRTLSLRFHEDGAMMTHRLRKGLV